MSEANNFKCLKKKRSEIFNFFSITGTDVAQCDLCKQNLSFKTSNSNLKKHMMRKHPTVKLPTSVSDKCKLNGISAEETRRKEAGGSLNRIRIPEDPDDPCAESSTSTATPSSASLPQTSKVDTEKRQQSMTLYIPKKVGVGTKKKIDEELMKLFTLDLQPFSVVEDEGFRSFVKALNPSYQLPTRHTVAQTMLPALFAKCETGAKNELKNTTWICLTTDCWTSANNDSFMAVTGHFIKDFDMKSVLLECCSFPVQHTSENIAAELSRVVNKWELEGKILLAISDHASNVKKAITEVLKWNFLGCMAHKLNLIVKGSLDPVSNILGNIRSIVVHFKRSSQSKEKLFSYQRNSGLEPKKLILDVPTRWNSTYFMLERFCELEEAVKSTLALIDKDLPTLSASDWKVAKDLCKVLKPFLLVTKSLSGEKYAPASLVIVLSNGLFDVCNKLMEKEFSTQVFQVVTALSAGVKDRLGFVEQNPLLSVAMFLDPRFKSCFRSTQQAEEVRLKVVNLVAAKLKPEQEQQGKETEKGTPTSENVEDDVNDDDDDLSPWASVKKQLAGAPKVNPTSKGHVEVRRYLEEPILDRKKDPLKWWKQNAHNYPYLSKVVQDRCCCLATSVPCERLFSKGGYILNDRRNRLSSNKVKQIMFISQNLKFS